MTEEHPERKGAQPKNKPILDMLSDAISHHSGNDLAQLIQIRTGNATSDISSEELHAITKHHKQVFLDVLEGKEHGNTIITVEKIREESEIIAEAFILLGQYAKEGNWSSLTFLRDFMGKCNGFMNLVSKVQYEELLTKLKQEQHTRQFV